MKSFRIILVLFLVSFQANSAEIQSLDDLKQKFDPLREVYSQFWERASKMKVLSVSLGTEIDKTQCQLVFEKIKSQYHYSIEKVVSQEGRFTFSFCQPQHLYFPTQFYFQAAELKNQFGLPIRYILQSRSKSDSTTSLNTLFLDSNYRIVEMNALTSRASLGETDPFEASVQAFNSEGSFYLNIYSPKSGTPPYSVQNFSSATGKIFDSTRIVRPRKLGYGQEIVQIESFSQTNQSDWTFFELNPVYASVGGGFYEYSGKTSQCPSHFDSITRYFVNSHPVCTEGRISRNHLPTYFKADFSEAEYGNCSSNW